MEGVEVAMRTKATFLLLAISFSTSQAQVFHDDFDGDAIDTTKWNVYRGGGTVVVNNGTVTLSAPCNTQFPYITTKSNPFPPTGDFIVRVGFRYPAVNIGGNGFGFDYNMRGFGAWQDACYSPDNPQGCGGLRVAVGDRYPVYLTDRNVIDTAYHVYEWTCLSGTYRFSLDGVLFLENVSSVRPDKFFFGHPPYSYCNWTTQEIDFVHIEILPMPVSAEGRSWDSIKTLYR